MLSPVKLTQSQIDSWVSTGNPPNIDWDEHKIAGHLDDTQYKGPHPYYDEIITDPDYLEDYINTKLSEYRSSLDIINIGFKWNYKISNSWIFMYIELDHPIKGLYHKDFTFGILSWESGCNSIIKCVQNLISDINSRMTGEVFANILKNRWEI